jgi:hypothetical protein
MGYRIIIYNGDKAVDDTQAFDIEQARALARVAVEDRMEAFADDRDALKRYGFLDAEDQALSLDEDGGVIFLQDGWKIEVINDDA